MSRKQALKVKITTRALIARINRKLRHEGPMGQILKSARSERMELDLGSYFIVDVQGNYIHDHHIDPEKLGRELGILQPWEELEAGAE